MFVRVQARAAALSAVQRIEQTRARAQLMSVVERLSRGPVDWNDVDAAFERLSESYGRGGPASLQDAMRTVAALAALRNGLGAPLDAWSATRRKFETGLRQASAFFNEREKERLGAVAAGLAHARTASTEPVRARTSGEVLPESLKALVVLFGGVAKPQDGDAPRVAAARRSLGALKIALAFMTEEGAGGATWVASEYRRAATNLVKAASGGGASAEFHFVVDGMARLERVAALFGFPSQEIRLMDSLSRAVTGKDLHGKKVSVRDWALALAGLPERIQGVTGGAVLAARFWPEVSQAFEGFSSRVPSSLRPVVREAFLQVRTLAENAYWPARRSPGGALISQHLGGTPQEMKESLQQLPLGEGNARQVLEGLLSRFFDKGGIPSMPALDAQKNWEKFLSLKLTEGDWQILESLHRSPDNQDLNFMAQSLALKVRSFAVLFIDLERCAVRDR
ncbi:hypothetical protein [Stigmatella erecta]|uniref:Uncharacterized protein n=1 Tax=Stigmatella erecta TaxID=83460 RepID=A0A1H9YSH8_9BACT|nr:hypothetical protein [Stigmatella erecta]SES72077.1 hypothetical protein SAMN05443639_10138 [Stigmatella erecta]